MADGEVYIPVEMKRWLIVRASMMAAESPRFSSYSVAIWAGGTSMLYFPSENWLIFSRIM